MKQNKTYKILTGLALVTILTTTVIGSTMANFTTATTYEDSANVASCNIEITGSDLFNKKYISDVEELAKKTTYSVKADAKVLAPGTSNKINLKFNGINEILLDGTYSLDLELNGDWEDGSGNFYCPINFKLTHALDNNSKEEFTLNGLDYSSKEDLLAALEEVVVCHEIFNANYLYEDYSPISIEWSWPFSTSKENDAKDTALMSNSAKNPISLKLICKTQFTQID